MSLDSLSLEARVLYTGFCLFLLIGSATSIWLYSDDGHGLSPANTTQYYLGNAGDAAPAPREHGGPALDIPQENIVVAKDARAVVETFHFHLFSVPVCLLIVGHLFMMTSWTTRKKVIVIAIGSFATLFHLVGPPLVRFVWSGFSIAFVISAILMTLTWALMLIAPLVEMWRRKT
jgi:hypothetical protein